MGTVQRRLARGSRHGLEVTRDLGSEIREARLASGLSQAALADAARISASEVSRLELGLVRGASVLMLARLLAIVGLRLSAKAYPDGSPLRDAAHARLLGRLGATLPPGVRLRLEVPLEIEGAGMRAWDAEIVGSSWTCKVEAETRLRDLQAVVRRIALKIADDRADCVILLVAASRANAAVLREFRPLLRANFPLGTRQMLTSLRRGEAPSASGVVVL